MVASAFIAAACTGNSGIIRYQTPSLEAEITLNQCDGAALSRLATMPENRQWALKGNGNPLFELTLKDVRDGADTLIVLNSMYG